MSGRFIRELKRRQRVWERSRREENWPLMEEWVPPAPEHRVMTGSLGVARAHSEILLETKARCAVERGRDL